MIVDFEPVPLTDLESRVKEACATAKLVGKETSQLAPVEPVVDEIKASMKKDFRDIPLSRKKALVEEYNQILLHYHEKIQTFTAMYADNFKTIWFASSEGTYIMEEKPNIYVYLQAIARDGDVVQRGFRTTGGAEGYQMVEGFHDKATEAASKGIELLSARPVKGGKYTVITNPKMSGVLTHEACGHLSEADFVYENPQIQEIMVLGKRFGVDNLNILDDGSIPGGLGTHRYDCEGTPTRKNYLIKDGILVGRLHSRETAAKMGEHPTGNARSVHFQLIFNNLGMKVSAVILSVSLWFFVASRGQSEIMLEAPLEFGNIPADLGIASSSAKTVKLTIRGQERFMKSMNAHNIGVFVYNEQGQGR